MPDETEPAQPTPAEAKAQKDSARQAAKAERAAKKAEQAAVETPPTTRPSQTPESNVSRKDLAKRLAALIADVGQLPKSEQSVKALRKLECAATALERDK